MTETHSNLSELISRTALGKPSRTLPATERAFHNSPAAMLLETAGFARTRALLALLLALLVACFGGMLAGCASDDPAQTNPQQEEAVESPDGEQESSKAFDVAQVPSYTGSPYTVVNDNVPLFTEADAQGPSELYSDLDDLGRCGTALAVVGTDTMPTEERGSIGMVKPSGWHTVRYDDLIADKYLYNRCHLIGYQLTGENANEKNLITGTRYMNVDGMLPFENEVAAYVKSTGNHVLYRVTPMFVDNELVARGVHMEALSVEDDGAGISFNVFCYNVQPGITIDYASGESKRGEAAVDGDAVANANDAASDTAGSSSASATPGASEAEAGAQTETDPQATTEVTYILNARSKKFHYPYCDSVDEMSPKNKRELTGTREEAIELGYVPCKWCCP